MTKLEIIDETVAYYSDPSKRAYDDAVGHCRYFFDGKMCAVGRCLIDPHNRLDSVGGSQFTEDDLKPEYRGHNISENIWGIDSFWACLQEFHDKEDHFDENGISDLGYLYIENMKKEWESQNEPLLL